MSSLNFNTRTTTTSISSYWLLQPLLRMKNLSQENSALPDLLSLVSCTFHRICVIYSTNLAEKKNVPILVSRSFKKIMMIHVFVWKHLCQNVCQKMLLTKVFYTKIWTFRPSIIPAEAYLAVLSKKKKKSSNLTFKYKYNHSNKGLQPPIL